MTRLTSAFLFGFAALSPLAHRSQGFAGSTPVGLDGYGAFAHFDCTRINTDPRRSHVRVPLSADCAVSVPSPNGQSIVTARSAEGDAITLTASGNLVVRNLEQPTTLLWKPDSAGFLLNDSEGSGQTSHLRWFGRSTRGWRESRALAIAADRLYQRRFDCRGGRASYTNVWGWDWTRSGLLRTIVQEGVHSAGCLQPHRDRNVLFEVIGDPATGRVASAREIATLP